MALDKRFVYVLRNRSTPMRYYTGVTANVLLRLAAHNAGHCTHTTDGRPWDIDLVVEFTDETRALRFERYLKSGSGVAFAKRHLRSPRIACETEMRGTQRIDVSRVQQQHALGFVRQNCSSLLGPVGGLRAFAFFVEPFEDFDPWRQQYSSHTRSWVGRLRFRSAPSR